MARKIRVSGVRREIIDSEQLALIYWLQAKRVLAERRQNDAKKAREKAKRRERQR